jgi:amino acid adenylation domain-containing protein
VLFALQNVPREQLKLPGLRLSRVGGEHVTAKLDLSLYVHETELGLNGHLEYATDLFEASTIERLAGHFRTLLDGIVADPDARLSDLPLLSEAERHQLLVAWNDTAAAYPEDRCLHALFAEQVARTPDAVAVTFEDRQLTYGELDRRSSQLAHHLVALGVGPEVIVGLCIERSLEMVVGLLGILKAGGAYLPLDPSYPAERLAYMLVDARAPVLVTLAHLEGLLPPHAARLVRLDADWAPIAANDPARAPDSGAGPGNLAYVIYTSGSTGRPKGVMIGHGALINFLSAMRTMPGLDGSDVLAATTPLSFDIAGLELHLPLLSGARVAVLPRAATLDGHALQERLNAVGATVVQATPASWRLLLEAGWSGAGTKVLCGGETLPGDVAAALAAGSAAAWNLYGPTETTIWSTVAPLGDGDRISIGRPLWNTRVYVLDGQLRPVPIGVAGELYIGGVGLARGYLGRPGLTAERFIPDPFGRGGRLYRTGDLGRWREDGDLEFLGRIDTQVKVRGYRIELGEIEAVLGAHPGVRQAVVVAREDEPGERRLVAYVVGEDGAAPAAGELRAHLKSRLPEYMVPSAFVPVAALPLTPSGKIDRKALLAPEVRPDVGAYVAPRTPTEEVLCGIWCELLKLDRVGVNDNFFELGGHSLLAMRVIAYVRRAFGVELPLRMLFDVQTVSQLSERIETIRWFAQQNEPTEMDTHTQNYVEGTL